MVKIFLAISIMFSLVQPGLTATSHSPEEVVKAQDVIAKDLQSRKEAASQELAEVLKKYRVRLSVGVLVTPNGNIPQLTLIPTE